MYISLSLITNIKKRRGSKKKKKQIVHITMEIMLKPSSFEP